MHIVFWCAGIFFVYLTLAQRQASPSRRSLASEGISSTEYDALYDLYNATQGPHWDWRNLTTGHVPWQFDFPADPCLDSWQGVECVTLGNPPFEVTSVTGVDLRARNLSGTIPSSISDLTRLEVLDLPRNNITSRLPSSMQRLEHLDRLILDRNSITGTLPEFIVKMKSLRTLFLSKNLLTGTIPASFCQMDKLEILYLNSNELWGTIPVCIGNMSNLAYLDLDSTSISGTIPTSMRNATHLRFLGLQHTQLTGTIPTFLGDLHSLQFLYLSDGHFRGTIPGSLGQLSELLFLHLYDNQLTGTLPPELGGMKKLQYFYIYNNKLSGTLPTSLAQLGDLHSFLAQGNRFTGTLDGRFNSTAQARITTIQVSSNRLSGTLPDEVFALPRLTTLVAVSNCFRGSLSAQICNRRSLEALVLDGLHSAPSCAGFQVPGFTVDASNRESFGGTIPPCVLQLPKLNTLHLSGNELTGTLPGSLAVGDRLLDLDLSHNFISGSIPIEMQQKVWYNLDLSYNRLSGQMRSDFYTIPRNFTFGTRFEEYYLNTTMPYTTAALHLENNRLSGEVANEVKTMLNVSVLEGNLFACSVGSKRDLPRHDSDWGNYQCASNSFDVPYYAWLCLVGSSVGLVLALWYWRSKIDRFVGFFDRVIQGQKWMQMLTQDNGLPPAINLRLQNISYVNMVFDAICRITLYAAVFILLLLLPLYALISAFYGTHARQYTYTVSSAFESGVVPFIVEFFLLAVFMLMVGFGFAHHMQKVDAAHGSIRNRLSVELSIPPEAAHTNHGATKRSTTRLERASVRFAFFAVNLLVVVGVNIGFVYIALYESTVLLVVAQVLLSFFKFLWNTVCNPFLIRWTANRLASSESARSRSSRAGFFSLQLFVSLFNNIVIPCCVVATVDPSCFYNVIVPADSEESHYVYAECLLYSVRGCVEVVPQIATVSYHPSFQYSYQCSSSFITYYAPTFVYMCFVATFVAPVTQMLAQRLHTALRPSSGAFRVLDFCLPPVLKPIQEGPIQRNVFKPYFDANLALVTLLTYLGIMLTFGAVFPPLAAAIAVTIFSVAYFTKLKVGRLITNVVRSGLYGYLDVIQQECRGVGSVRKIRQSAWMLVAFSCAFYMLFLFDTLGNSVGFVSAVWVVFVVPLAPWLAYGSIKFLARLGITPGQRWLGASAGHAVRATEMKDLGGGKAVNAVPFSDAAKLALEYRSGTLNILHESLSEVEEDRENGAADGFADGSV